MVATTDTLGGTQQVSDEDEKADVVLTDTSSNGTLGGAQQVSDDDEKADIISNDTSSNGVIQKRNVSIVCESGMYSLVRSSRKPEANFIH